MENGSSAEMAMVGCEGVIGIALFMAGGASTNRAVVLSAGYAYRLSGHILMQGFNRFGGRRNGTLHDLLLNYTHTLITQMAQRAVCNQHHSVDQRLCNWVLLNLDRQSRNELMITHELIANMLGVSRECITENVGEL